LVVDFEALEEAVAVEQLKADILECVPVGDFVQLEGVEVPRVCVLNEISVGEI